MLEYTINIDLAPHTIPGYTADGLMRYVNQKIQPGNFLYCVLTNDLFGAIQCADTDNLKSLPDLVKYIYNALPFDIYGSKEVVEEWLKKS